VRLFEAAVRKYPQNLIAMIDGSRALGARFEITRAEAMLDGLMKQGARQADVLHLAGQSYRMIFRPDKAMECFRRVLAMTREIPDAYLELAILYERRHRLEEARVLIEDCVRGEPDYLEAQLFKARLLRRLKEELLPEREGGYRFSNSDPITGQAAWYDLRVSIEKAAPDEFGETWPQFVPLHSPALAEAAP
jgi:tetratricopeptide (TPR) repeat protein